jgi:hypothetical protein
MRIHRLPVLTLLLAMIGDGLGTWHGLSLGASELSPLVQAYGWGWPIAMKLGVVLAYAVVLEMVPSIAVMRTAALAATFTIGVAVWNLAQ